MDYKVIDVLRGPSIVLLDALLSRKLIFPPISSVYLQFLFRFFGACASMLLLASNQAWLIEFYRFIVGAFLLALSTFLQTYLVASCYETYKANHTPINESIVVSLLKTTIESKNMQNTEIDLTIKVSFYLLLQLMLYRVFICKYLYGERGHWIGQSLGHFLSTLSSLAVLLNLSEGIFVACTFVTLLPQFLPLHSAVFMGITLILQRVQALARMSAHTVREHGLPIFIQNVWINLRVPQVLRIFFTYRCLCVLFIICFTVPTAPMGENTSKPMGIYYYMVKMRNLLEQNNLANTSVPNNTIETTDLSNSSVSVTFNLAELGAIMLTDSIISIFSIGSAVSVPLYYCGIKLHDFVGGADLEQAESLGTISAVLFCLLAVQTGLSGLPPLNRLLRLYRNACLLIAAVLHYMHDLVHPVLINLSAQVNISVKKHIKPLLVALVLLILPLCFSIWLVKTTPISTWLIAVTAFSIELIVKVVSTLMLYMLFAADARIDHKPWPHLDDWVFYVQATGHTIEFICGCVMFVNGAYVLIFESGSALRAFMMSMHAYVNIYKSAKEGLKTLYNRQTVNTRIAKLTQASPDILMDHTDDVCSICYQEFSNEFGDVRITNCEHLFHSTCLRKWLYIQDACPMCHQNIFKESKTE